MLTILPFINVVLLIVLWYGASFALVGWLVTRRKQPSLPPDAHLRTAIRDTISQLLLDMAEQGDELTVLGLMERCPAPWHTGKGWSLWVEESYKMALQGTLHDAHPSESSLLND